MRPPGVGAALQGPRPRRVRRRPGHASGYRPRKPIGLPSASAKHAHPRLRCDSTRGVALGCTCREQGCAGRVEILDVSEGHRSAGHVARSQADLEATVGGSSGRHPHSGDPLPQPPGTFNGIDGSTEQNVTAMDDLTVISEQQRTQLRGGLAAAGLGRPEVDFALVGHLMEGPRAVK
jgi:hypothetical protein